jgi:hypothetical protein
MGEGEKSVRFLNIVVTSNFPSPMNSKIMKFSLFMINLLVWNLTLKTMQRGLGWTLYDIGDM